MTKKSIPIPRPIQDYALLGDAECEARIVAAKQKLGKRVLILAHHYQRNEVFRYADLTGDSLKLSREAAHSKAEFIVFCGVHFMAEVADILSPSKQTVILPDLAAGCSMADMANLPAVERCWRELTKVLDPDTVITPVTYINSTADLKAFCGKHGGIVCTSSNAGKILEWSFSQTNNRPSESKRYNNKRSALLTEEFNKTDATHAKVLFFPDQHLGRNTGYRMGIPLEEMVVWDPSLSMGGLSLEQIRRAKIILWKGYCSVHQAFIPEHIDIFLKDHPQALVISHPECAFDVCQKSQYVGSTEYILKTIHEAPSGTCWLVGTEVNLVNRLAEEVKSQNKEVHFMSPSLCMCSTMFRIDVQHLAWVLENLVNGVAVNRIHVAKDEAQLARLALERMLQIV